MKHPDWRLSVTSRNYCEVFLDRSNNHFSLGFCPVVRKGDEWGWETDIYYYGKRTLVTGLVYLSHLYSSLMILWPLPFFGDLICSSRILGGDFQISLCFAEAWSYAERFSEMFNRRSEFALARQHNPKAVVSFS